MRKAANKLVAMAVVVFVITACANRISATRDLQRAADQLSRHPCLKAARVEKVADHDVAAIAFCEKEGLVVFYRPGMTGGIGKIGSINVNEPVSSLPTYMNVYQPFSELESKIGSPDKTKQSQSFQTFTYKLRNGLTVGFDVVPQREDRAYHLLHAGTLSFGILLSRT